MSSQNHLFLYLTPHTVKKLNSQYFSNYQHLGLQTPADKIIEGTFHLTEPLLQNAKFGKFSKFRKIKLAIKAKNCAVSFKLKMLRLACKVKQLGWKSNIAKLLSIKVSMEQAFDALLSIINSMQRWKKLCNQADYAKGQQLKIF